MIAPPSRDGISFVSLTFGVIALVCALIPVIGDLISALPALVAIACGAVGIVRHEKHRTRGAWASVLGAGLGALALALIAFLAAMNHLPA